MYYSDKVLKGTSTLSMCYTVDDKFAYAEYIFPNDLNGIYQMEITKKMMSKKYGRPTSSKKDILFGTYIWEMDDGIEIKLYSWPFNNNKKIATYYIRYTYPKHYQLMIDEQERQKKEKEKKEYELQKDAF